MGKRILQLYVDDEMIQIAKSRQINMSALFRGMLNTEFKLIKGKEVETLKVMVARVDPPNFSLKVFVLADPATWPLQMIRTPPLVPMSFALTVTVCRVFSFVSSRVPASTLRLPTLET